MKQPTSSPTSTAPIRDILVHNSSTVVRFVEVPIIALIVKPPQYHIDQSHPQDSDFYSHFKLLQMEIDRRFEEMLRPLKPIPLVGVGAPEGSDDYTEVTLDKEQCLCDHYTAHVTPPAYTPSLPFLSSVDDLVPIPRESEVTSDSNLECDMPNNTPLPTTDVREENFDINSPLGEYVVDDGERGCSWLS
ncbi:hypothetical protein Tco_0950260 [Tanacetum coccineum]